MFSSEQWLANSGSNFYNGVALTSVRCDPASNPKLVFTPSSASNRKTWTWSCWVKRSSLGSAQIVFNVGVTGTDEIDFHFTADDQFIISDRSGHNLKTAQLFRDTLAWYNLVVVMDTVQSGVTFSSANALKLYVNGVRVTVFASGTSLPDEDDEFAVNNTRIHHIATRNLNDNDFGGYLAEMNLVDGIAVGETSGYLDEFGELKNGVWIPKKYTGSYGTNGWRLQFDQTGVGTASTSTIGADTSGNTHHFTSSGIVASDCAMPDSPENNFATLNPLNGLTGITYSVGNIKMTGSASNNALSSMAVSSGKYYFEVYSADNGGSGNLLVGIIDTSAVNAVATLATNNGTYRSNGVITNLAGSAQTAGATYGTGNYIGVAVDVDAGTVQFYKDNVAQGATPSFSFTANTEIVPHIRCDATDSIAVINFGQDPTFAKIVSAGTATGTGVGVFRYAPPSGFLSLCTANLPEPTIGANSDTQADDYFNTVLYTGASSGQGITGVGFQPDWTWIKSRSHASSHVLTDSSRGVTKSLFSDNAVVESTLAGGVTAFGTDGFTLGTEGTVNTDTRTYVAWNWKANGGTTSSNTDGSITSTVQANTDAGFSIVAFEGNKTKGATIGHGLGVKPDMIIMKNRDLGVSWAVWFPNLQANNQLLELNSTGAVLTNTVDVNAWWNNTAPTSSLITLGDYDGINDDLSMIAYCFNSVEGYSKFGSYTGNGNADGTFVYLGFHASLIICKRTDGVTHWQIHDIKRSPLNPSGIGLLANTNDADGVSTVYNLDITSNGFKLRDAHAGQNVSGGTYIYMAFAEAPFKYANAR